MGIVSVRASIIEHYCNVTLVVDVMLVSGLSFLVTLLRGLTFVTVQYVPRRTAGELCNSLKEVIRVYSRAGLQPRLALMDGEFDKLIPLLSHIIEVNTTAKNEHVPEIKQKIRHIKDRARAIKAATSFTILPNAVSKALVIHVVLWMNTWPAKAGVSDD